MQFGTASISAIYTPDFYEMHKPWQGEYVGIANVLCQLLEFNSVLDLGCGNGFVLSRLKELGKEIVGIDGSQHAFAAMPENIVDFVSLQDLTSSHMFSSQFQLVICMEVAEHLPAQYADVLVDSICRNAAKFIYFTAATPWQGGLHHVNEQPQCYWREKFQARGFRIDASLTDKLRIELGNIIQETKWFVRNSVIYISSTAPE